MPTYMLLAPSVKGLRCLINVCHRFGLDNDIVFNDSKTVFMKILSSEDLWNKISFPPVSLGSKKSPLYMIESCDL